MFRSAVFVVFLVGVAGFGPGVHAEDSVDFASNDFIQALACEELVDSVELTWLVVFDDFCDEIVVSRNGEDIATVDPDEEVFVDDAPPDSGALIYAILCVSPVLCVYKSCVVREPASTLSAESVEVQVGEQFEVSITLNSEIGSQAVAFGMSHDPELLSFVDLLVGSGIEDLNGGDGPHFFTSAALSEDDEDGFVHLAYFVPIFDDAFAEVEPIPAGEDVEIAIAVYDVLAGNGTSTSVTFTETLGTPAVAPQIIVAHAGPPVLDLVDAEVTILDREFIRGDSNDNGVLEIADASLTTEALFGDESFPCARAADFDDDEELDLLDVLGVLEFLFLGGAPPGAPFPACGPGTGSVLTCTAGDACL